MDKPLANADFEKCAEDMAKVWDNRNAVQTIYEQLRAKYPDMKYWEANSLCQRARYLDKQLYPK